MAILERIQALIGREHRTRQAVGICVILGLATLALYWPVHGFDFLNYDDQDYVSMNPQVQGGLTAAALGWAFTTDHAGNWHPLAWLSHMLDCQVFGLDPGAHHLVNTAFHAVNSVLLFLLLRRLTGATWRSAWVAGIFALHPLHVESVAWVSERKDVLSAFFFILTLLAYDAYVRARNSGSRLRLWGFYVLALALSGLGLMSKPMLVTVPFVLLLLDFWPLQRLSLGSNSSEVRGRLLEKIPFLAFSAVASVLTYRAQQHSGYVAELTVVPLGLRIQNAVLSYGSYLKQMLWPEGLAVYYPYPNPMPVEAVALAAVVVLGISLLALKWLRRRPYVAVGWFWYLGMLVPVIGLVQVGAQSMADRYSYLPLVGIFIVIAWALGEAAEKPGRARVFVGAVAVAAVLVCAPLTAAQLKHWRGNEPLYRHALAVTGENPTAAQNLGCELLVQKRFPEAEALFAEAVRLRPRLPAAYSNLGFALSMQGKTDEAIAQYHTALELDPSVARTRTLLASALLAAGKRDEAIAEYKTALQADPEWLTALNDLAWLLATDPADQRRDGTLAVTLGQRLCEKTKFREPQFIGTLAAAYAEAGQFSNAVATAHKAADLAETAGLKELAARNRQLLELYRSGKPCRDGG